MLQSLRGRWVSCRTAPSPSSSPWRAWTRCACVWGGCCARGRAWGKVGRRGAGRAGRRCLPQVPPRPTRAGEEPHWPGRVVRPQRAPARAGQPGDRGCASGRGREGEAHAWRRRSTAAATLTPSQRCFPPPRPPSLGGALPGGVIDPSQTVDREEAAECEKMHSIIKVGGAEPCAPCMSLAPSAASTAAPAHAFATRPRLRVCPLPSHEQELNMGGCFRWIVAQKNRVRNGELYRYVADLGGAFVQPALYEAFGLTVVEAMTCGLPTFATNHGGPSEIIKHKKSGARAWGCAPPPHPRSHPPTQPRPEPRPPYPSSPRLPPGSLSRCRGSRPDGRLFPALHGRAWLLVRVGCERGAQGSRGMRALPSCSRSAARCAGSASALLPCSASPHATPGASTARGW